METEVEGQQVGGQQPPTSQESRNKLEEEVDGAQPAAATACFDCNICLDFAVEPVVTLCGHLYCWPCLYKWLRQGSTAPQQQCPVCKADVSPATLVPLYGRGCTNSCKDVHGSPDDIPRRPPTTLAASGQMMARRVHQHQEDSNNQRQQHGNYMVSSSSTTTAINVSPTMLGGTAIAVLPWLFGDEWMGGGYYRGLPHLTASNNSPRLRRQEMRARRSLHRISIFFFCCVVLCLLVF